MPGVRGYDNGVSRSENNRKPFTTHFPRFGRAVEDMKDLDIRMPVRLSFIAGSTSLYSSSNRKLGTIVAHDGAVFGQRPKGYGSGWFVSDHFQWIIHQEGPWDVALVPAT
jgi:hypothetical protein